MKRQRSQADCLVELGVILYRHRLENGLSLRVLARRLGLSSHSSLVEYEKGRRLPPEEVLRAYEGFFALPSGSLQRLRRNVFTERADAKVRQRLALAEPGRLATAARRLLTLFTGPS